jgi:hypothetical protein
MNKVISYYRVLHVHAEKYCRTTIIIDLVIFDSNISATLGTDYSDMAVVMNFVITNYHILGARMWVQSICFIVMNMIIFDQYTFDTIRIEPHFEIMNIVVF